MQKQNTGYGIEFVRLWFVIVIFEDYDLHIWTMSRDNHGLLDHSHNEASRYCYGSSDLTPATSSTGPPTMCAEHNAI